MAQEKQSFSQLIEQNEQPVLVDFYADWCGPCKVLSPIVQEIARDFTGKLKVIKVDTDRNQQAAMKFQIRGIPTLMLFQKGEAVWRHSGVLSKQELTSKLEEFI